MGSLSLLLLSSMVICSASSDRDSSIVWLPLSVRDSLLLNFFILSAGYGLKNSASAEIAGSGRTGGRARRTSGCRSGGGGRAEAPQAQASPFSRLPLREGRRPPHAWPSPPLNMAPGPRSLADGPVLRAAEPGRSEAAGRGLLDRRALGRPQLPLSFVCVRVAFSRSEAAA